MYMKYIPKIYSLPVLLSLLIFTSCKKYLDEKSDKKLVELKTLNDLQALLDNADQLNDGSTPGFGETSADDYFIRSNDYNALGRDLDRQAYTWQVTDYTYSNDWSYSYQALYPANYCLDHIDNITRTSQNAKQWDNVKGSALFIRAFRFLVLTWEYGKAYDESNSQSDPGIALRLNSDPSIPSVRSSVKDCYDRVILDAEAALDYLPNNPSLVTRSSKSAAFGVLARAFLSMRKYDSAFKYVDSSLQIKNDLLDYNSPEVDPFGWVSFQPFNKEILYYTTQTGNYPPKDPYLAAIDTSLYDSYDDNDLRKTVFFYDNNGYHSFKGTYGTFDINYLFSGIATDEMYLTRAECHARANPARIDEAMADLNLVLINRWASGTFTPLTATTQQQALSMILTERRKELLMRGLRWIDIKRLNKEGANITPKRIIDGQTYTIPPNDKRYALPLPKDIIDLTGMMQN
jgi:hypothetical protein